MHNNALKAIDSKYTNFEDICQYNFNLFSSANSQYCCNYCELLAVFIKFTNVRYQRFAPFATFGRYHWLEIAIVCICLRWFEISTKGKRVFVAQTKKDF